MTDQNRSEIISNNPIDTNLNSFRLSFDSTCREKGLACSPDALGQLDQEDLQNLAFKLLSALQTLPAARLLRSGSGKPLFSELLRLYTAVGSDDFDYDLVKPLFAAVIAKKPDEEIWTRVYHAVTESTPPPRPIASSLQQTPWPRNTGSFVNSSEHRKYVDDVLKEELGTLYVGLRHFHDKYFGGVTGLTTASQAVFDKCKEGSNPLFGQGGWSGWPQDANQDGVLSWFTTISDRLATLAEEYSPTLIRRRLLVQPNQPIQGSTAERKIDVGFVSSSEVIRRGKCHWSQMLIPGELKSNPSADTASKTWLDIGRYVREVLFAQDTRRFVIAFTLCGSFMRIWVFDRLGGIASDRFNINENGLRFVSTMLGFFWMSEEQLGFDPTIITSNGKRYIEIDRNGRREHLVIDAIPLVIKDSWQYTERGEEGELLREATNKEVINIARYYHHYTVQVRGTDDDIQSNVRKGLDITTADNYRPPRSAISRVSTATVGSREGRSTTPSQKRSASQTDASLPPSKRSCSVSPTKIDRTALPNRIHRRLIIQDYGKPIYEASSRAALLEALEGCIIGHESLHGAGILHRDISINNLMINEDANNPSRRSFLIDLDLAIKEQREGASGAKGKTGTRAFMAIGTLRGEQHSFVHDLESFFWVLFWICIHYDGPGKHKVVPKFDKWNYVDMDELETLKVGTVLREEFFKDTFTQYFTPYYAPLIPWVNRLRKVVFGNNAQGADLALYSQMREILCYGRKCGMTYS
ncbi:uncharacterized protein F4812DRAFT_460838 [Daldinia caldariorum]|uniref:uncharacterized protein n=1 Tax=Daldinia caldariorum TaxID=326644 RepID=UPI002008CD5D|nr:uncharacterized protein F4812DRAFT_460838 [Daldinia caldariorum]KAI1466569.1 hypothetical protein F4812DRAFT_460838 [Daldinia caldariorum]